MPVTADDFLWEKADHHATGTSVVVTHPDAGGTTAGTTLIAMLYSGTITAVPAGWALIATTPSQMYVKSDVSAAETSWTWTLSVSGTAAWYFLEIDNVALVDPAEGFASGGVSTIANGATKSSGTSGLNAGSSGVALARLGAIKGADTETISWSGWTNGFTERVDSTSASGTAGRNIAVAYKLYEGWSTYETTATFATSAATNSTSGQIVLLRSADASINAPLDYHTGFEFGTHAGMGTAANSPLGNAAGAPSGTWGTNYLVQAGSARNGSYGLDVVASASVAHVLLPQLSAGLWAFGGNIKVESGSGTPDVLYFDITGGASNDDLKLQYDVTNEKFGLVWRVAGVDATVVWQTGTTPLNSWAWVDIRARYNSSVWHADWSIETGTGDGSQTSPTDLTGHAVSGTPTTIFYLGSPSSRTATVHYDDIVFSRYAGAYPLGPHIVQLLVPETTGATISGTSSNFSKFTANGTLAAWAGDAGALLDEVPPTVSASSDGVVQTAVAASDYAEFPMTPPTLAQDDIIAAVRFVAAEWGGTGSGTGTLGWRGHDGLTETTFQAASASYDADSLTAISATYPRWVSAMWSGAANGAWTQTRLDATAVRMGFSTDATPDMGASAVYLEVATRSIANPVVAHRLTSDEDPESVAATVTERLHPYNSGVRIYTVSNNDATRTAEFRFYETGGAEHADSPVVVAPLDPPVDVTIGAEAFGEIESTTFGWQ